MSLLLLDQQVLQFTNEPFNIAKQINQGGDYDTQGQHILRSEQYTVVGRQPLKGKLGNDSEYGAVSHGI